MVGMGLRKLLAICAVIAMIGVSISVVVEVKAFVGLLRRHGVALQLRSPIAMELRGPMPPGEEFAGVNRVSDYPADWIAAVSTAPVYQLRAPSSTLPNATDSATCKARIQPVGEVPNLMIAHFPAELPMQVDLANEGYKWYAFAFDRGKMLAFATWSESTVTDPDSGMAVSPVLQPLARFGFNIYAGPGP
jgi:hypothetical protein